MRQTKSVTLNPGESKIVEFTVVPTEADIGTRIVTVNGLSGSFLVLSPPGPPGIELLGAWFNDGEPMTKEPGGTFKVTVKIKNNLQKEWSPSNLRFGFGSKVNGFTFVPLVWGTNPFTGEVLPEWCADSGTWPLGSWPVIPPGATKEFQTTYGLCPGAAGGVYDGCISMTPDGEEQTIIQPNILTVSKIADAEILEGKLTRVVDGYQAHYFVEVTVTNNTPTTFRGTDGTRLIAHILRPSDRREYGAYPYPPGYVDIPPGTTTFSWDFFGLSHWGMEKIILPDPLDYILEVGLSLYLPYGEVAFITKEFEGTIALG